MGINVNDLLLLQPRSMYPMRRKAEAKYTSKCPAAQLMFKLIHPHKRSQMNPKQLEEMAKPNRAHCPAIK